MLGVPLLLSIALVAACNERAVMTSSDDRDDLGNIAIAVIFTLVVGTALYLFNGAGAPRQTAQQLPITIDRTVSSVVPSQPE